LKVLKMLLHRRVAIVRYYMYVCVCVS